MVPSQPKPLSPEDVKFYHAFVESVDNEKLKANGLDHDKGAKTAAQLMREATREQRLLIDVILGNQDSAYEQQRSIVVHNMERDKKAGGKEQVQFQDRLRIVNNSRKVIKKLNESCLRMRAT